MRTSAIVRARIEHDGRELLVEVQLNRGSANRAQVNRSPIKTRELPRYFSSVLFAPEDLALVRGEPGIRRRFLDQLLVQRNPRLAAVMADYERVLKQRNTLLKSARASRLRESQLGTLDIWDERLVALGSELIDARLDLVAQLTDPLVGRVPVGRRRRPPPPAAAAADDPRRRRRGRGRNRSGRRRNRFSR